MAACREALKERTRERVPLDWVMTQNNLGNSLWSLGERESGTTRLEEVVAAHEAALGIFKAAHASRYVEVAKHNRARVQTLLHERRSQGKQ